MSEFSTNITCPHCHVPQAAPTINAESLPVSLSCVACGGVFVMQRQRWQGDPATANEQPSPVPMAQPVGGPGNVPMAQPVTPTEMEAPAGDAAFEEEARGGARVPVGPLLAMGSLIAAVVLAVGLLLRGDPLVIQAGAPRVDPDQSAKGATETAERVSNWVDASKASLQIDRVNIRVKRVEFGHVNGRNEKNRITLSADSYLAVYVQLNNQAGAPRGYRSWCREDPDGSAKLSDDSDRVYGISLPADIQRIRGRTAEADLVAGEVVEDVLLFVTPADWTVGGVEYLRLELAASAFGGEGVYRFQLPGNMIRDLSSIESLSPSE